MLNKLNRRSVGLCERQREAEMKSRSSNDEVDLLLVRIGNTAAILLYAAAVLAMILAGFRGHPYSTGGVSQHRILSLSQSLQHFMAALLAFICFWIAGYHKRNGSGGARRPWLWMVLFTGFIYAAYDKSLNVHEKLRPILTERFPSLAFAHDVLITFYAVAAIVFTVFFIAELRPVPRAARFYVTAMGLFIFAAAVDYVQMDLTSGTLAFTISGIVEETSQYLAGTTFALAFLFYALDRSWLALAQAHLPKPVSSREQAAAGDVQETGLLPAR